LPEQAAQAGKAEAFWLELLADRPEELELPADRPRPPQKTYASGRVQYKFGIDFLPSLKEAARRLDSTVFHLLTASFQAWLYRVTGREDIVLAIPTAGQTASGLRRRQHADRLVGHCVNMLPVRLTGKGEDSFGAYLHDTKSRLLDARDHQEVSYGNLVNKLQWPRDPSRVPMASVSLNFGLAHELRLGDLDTETCLPPKAHNFFDLTADVLEGQGKLSVDCKFNLELFDASTVERWLAQWECLLTAAIQEPETAVRDLELLPEQERHTVLAEWNSTGREYPRDSVLHGLLENKAKEVSRRTAVVSDDAKLTYGQLEKRATRIARALRERGARRGQLIGVCVARNTDMLAAVLGVLKSGAAYVPLDPSFPRDRLRFMAADADIALLISTSEYAADYDVPRERQLLLDADSAAIGSQDDSRLSPDAERDAGPEDPAYVIYTSGSTGKPKGVVVPHRAVVNFLASMAREPGMGEKDILVAVTTLSFDIAVLELYLPLLVGARVVIANREAVADGQALNALLGQHRATMMQATPVTWRLLLDAGWQGDRSFKALVGGEAFPRDLASQLLAIGVDLWNMYGPTETTVWSTCANLTDAEEGITIGGPIANTSIYVLDSQRNPCPIGVPGELYIGGEGVTLGYWRRPELTNERFVPDPFAASSEARMYATGDRARWLDKGVVEHLGRFDDQVKVRGFRIELGEIEANIARHPDISGVAVVAREHAPGDVRLVAYIVADEPPGDLEHQLRTLLSSALPDYMVPAHFVRIDELPRTNNGKLDRKALPEVDLTKLHAGETEAPPRTETERALAGIWAEVLGFEVAGIRENFFELGGHSLLATKVVARVRQTMSIEIRLRDFFVAPTISGLADRIDELGEREQKVAGGF
jgi:amino acid adenylation domain-containing protein